MIEVIPYYRKLTKHYSNADFKLMLIYFVVNFKYANFSYGKSVVLTGDISS